MTYFTRFQFRIIFLHNLQIQALLRKKKMNGKYLCQFVHDGYKSKTASNALKANDLRTYEHHTQGKFMQKRHDVLITKEKMKVKR